MKVTKTFLLCAMILPLLASCAKKQYYVEEGSIFHTIYHIKYEATKPLSDSITLELQKFDLSMNPFNNKSIIARVNHNENVEVNDWFIRVFNCAMKVSANSHGKYDITCAPLVNLWGFGFSKKDSVTPQVVDSLKQFVGYQKVHLNGRKVVKDDPRLMLDCSSVAKGYASDVIAELLERNGVTNYMVEIGGEVTMSGKNERGEFWKIGIDKPIDDSTGVVNEVEEVIQLGKKGGIATSGNYRNYYIKDGKKYAHEIDPQTGYPAEQNILSATIVAPNCMTADAYATAFMVLGLDEARAMKAKVPEIEYFVIYVDEEGHERFDYSEGMVQYLPGRKGLTELEKP